MVRKITMEGTLDLAGPETVFNMLFGNDEFMRRYHKKINSDPHAEASSWGEDQEREVKYVASTEVPKILTKLIGESFPVREVQRFQKNGNCYTITCIPRMDSVSGDQYVTQAETILAPDESGGCAITSLVTLEYSGVWFKGAVESFMEAKARTGFDQWLTLAKLFCQEKLAITTTQEGDENEQFFDAEEAPTNGTLSVVPNSVSPTKKVLSRFKSALSESTDNNSRGLDSYLIQTVIREATDMEALAIRVLKMEDDLAFARRGWERQQGAFKGQVEQLHSKLLRVEDDLASVRRAWERQLDVVSSRRQSALIGAGFAAGFAAGVAVGYLYIRSKRQT